MDWIIIFLSVGLGFLAASLTLPKGSEYYGPYALVVAFLVQILSKVWLLS